MLQFVQCYNHTYLEVYVVMKNMQNLPAMDLKGYYNYYGIKSKQTKLIKKLNSEYGLTSVLQRIRKQGIRKI